MYVLWYLNPQVDPDEFEGLVKYICNKRTGFITFTPSSAVINSIIYDVSMMDLEKPPPNKLRKIIFKEFSGLTTEEKFKIVGQMVGRSKSVTESDIYQCMLDLHDENKFITILGLARILKCSPRTIHRNMSMELKKEKELLNKEI